MSGQDPQTLDYLGLSQREKPRVNVPALLSISGDLAAMIFMFTVIVGMWRQVFPPLEVAAGWIVLVLALNSVICGGVGAVSSPRESRWYAASLIGYAGGMFVGTLSPMFFMLF